DFSFSYVIDTIAPLPPTVSLEDYVVLPNGIILSGNDLPALVGLLIKEELHHFWQVREVMQARNIPYVKITASRYAKGMLKAVRT
ncbi:tRNA isopentenyl-2-thiomethyl-A-37 hydroxylase MiaE, partial [Salmonella enterica subsp. enterica serovar Kentucky]|nr:tRNA isopentenyl-2-thiomethyl-A-37 hydroxylase MiaE [Salmonella enterica subsp. enterica serovar Kentucky]